jgi:hypothetical protein
MDHIEINEDFREALRQLREVRDAIPEVCDSDPSLPQRNSDLFRVKGDSFRAVATGDLVITLEPTEGLMDLIAAIRAWKAERRIGKEI